MVSEDKMISVEHLTRRFGPITAVDDVTFDVGKGQVLGFLGPNGAGKTTTMRILTGFIKPDKGTAVICGFDIEKNAIKAKESLGYLAENAPLYNEMTVGGFLNFVCDVRNINGGERTKRLDEIVPICAIESVYNQSIETLSKGYRRRVGLAQAMIHEPPVLILDEPTDGLDPNQKYEVRELIKKMSSEKCIIVSTHILEEVEQICTRTIIIAEGKILADSTPQGLKEKYNCGLDEVFRKIVPLGR